jgi:hypothetical protein
MNTKLLGLTLFALTAGAVALYPELRGAATAVPPVTPAPPRSEQASQIEVVFVLDTTSSMSGLIATAKEKIWSIATTMSQTDPAPQIRMGLVAFRDRGDAYVTRVVDLSTDLDSVYATLMDFEAVGGGDGPESVNAALDDAVTRISWSQNPASYKVIFLVGDAPPHMDYPDDRRYHEIVADARRQGIVVNTIQCGEMPQTTAPWIEIAQLGGGRYLKVGQTGSAVAVATPFDGRLAELAAALDATRVYYGSEDERRQQARKLEAAERVAAEASPAAQARRAAFNATASGAANLLGERELVDDVSSGRVDLDAIALEQLPETLRALPQAEQQAIIDETAVRRTALQREIRELAAQRDAFVAGELEAAGGADGSLDGLLYDVVREQGAAKGLIYDDGPRY